MEEEKTSRATINRGVSSDYVLPELPELSTPEARQSRMTRLAQETKAREESERLFVSIGGTLLDAQGKRDVIRTALIRDDLKKEAERKRLERERQEKIAAVEGSWECYENKWGNLLSLSPADGDARKELTYADIPWPVFGACKCHPGPADLEKELQPTPSFSEARRGRPSSNSMQVDFEITPTPNSFLNEKTMGAFLFHPFRPGQEISRTTTIQKSLLRWHPDKFNYRVLNRICDSDWENVKIDAARVVQILTHWKEDETAVA